MPTEYRVVHEADQDLKNFRIKIIELCLLTLTALFALLSITKNQWLLVPASTFSISMMIALIALLCGANRNVTEIEFQKTNQLVSPVKMTTLSYQFTKWEYASLSVYALGILLFLLTEVTPSLTN